MTWRAPIAVCLVFCLSFPLTAQDSSGPDALFRQAVARENGSPKDYAAASRLYADAARQGHTPSMVRLGFLLQSGTGVSKDLPTALDLFTRAAKAGNRDGEFMLAMTHLHGLGTAKDPAAARKLLLQTAGANHQYAQYLLAIMIENGEGGPKGEAVARRWFDRASAGPDEALAARAADLRDKIDKNMLAPDNSGGMLLAAVLLMAAVGTVLQGGDTGGPSSSGAGPGFGGGPNLSPPPCRPVPIPMIGTSMTPNGTGLSNPGPNTMMGGC
jgi:hypothetical protein